MTFFAKRRASRACTALGVAVLAAAALPAGASADAPGQIRIDVMCGTERLEATSGLGGFAAWISERDGQRVVLRPMAVAGTVTDARGELLRTYDEALGRHDPGPTTACSFSFMMGSGPGAVTVAGHGDFLVGPGQDA